MIDPEKFIQIFGVTVWVCQKIIAFSGFADQFKNIGRVRTRQMRSDTDDKRRI